MSDLRSLGAKARDAFIESREGKSYCDPVTIGARPGEWQYLKNRIEAAFIAGWNACEKIQNEAQKERTR